MYTDTPNKMTAGRRDADWGGLPLEAEGTQREVLWTYCSTIRDLVEEFALDPATV